MEKNYANTNKNKAEVSILTSDKDELTARKIIRDREILHNDNPPQRHSKIREKL